MPTNLFDAIDGLFRGLLYFFYNIIVSIWTILRSPAKGAYSLYRKYNSDGQRQVSSVTLIFVIFIICDWLINSKSQLPYEWDNILSNPPEFDKGRAWTSALGAFISTMLLDSSLRIFTYLRFKRSKFRRVTSIIIYSFAPPVIFVALIPNIIDKIAWIAPVDANYYWYFILLIVFVFFLVLTFVWCRPAAILIFRLKPTRLGVARPASRVRMLALQTSIFFLVLLSEFIGIIISSISIGGFYEEREKQRIRDNLEPLELLWYDCVLDTQRPRVQMLLKSQKTSDLIIDPDRDFRVFFRYKGIDKEQQRLLLVSEARDAMPILLKPGEKVLLQLFIEPPLPSLDRYNGCTPAVQQGRMLGHGWKDGA